METQLEIFYNTTSLKGDELKAREKRIGGQNKAVLDYFKAHSYENFTPWELSERTGIFIVSARRAMTDLTSMGYLERTDVKRPGQFKELCYAWKLK